MGLYSNPEGKLGSPTLPQVGAHTPHRDASGYMRSKHISQDACVYNKYVGCLLHPCSSALTLLCR